MEEEAEAPSPPVSSPVTSASAINALVSRPGALTSAELFRSKEIPVQDESRRWPETNSLAPGASAPWF